MTPLLKAALNSGEELRSQLEDVIAVDDRCKVKDIPDATVLHEARYVRDKYTDGSGGFGQHDEYLGECGPEARKEARKQVAAINRFLKKHDTTALPAVPARKSISQVRPRLTQ